MLTESKVGIPTMLVTGAGGFVGGRVVEMAHLSGFARVRAGLRRWNSAARVARFAVDMQLCDVLDQEQLDRSIEGMDTVIHCAAGSGDVITRGTANALEAAQRHKVKRFVHISTAEVYGRVSGEISETSPCKSMNNEYADAKIEAEKLCWEYNSKGLPVVILRPSIIYGPFSDQYTVRIAERLFAGGIGYMKDSADGLCNLVYVDDLVRSIFLSIRRPDAIGEAFNINGPEKVTWNDYFKQFGAALKIPDFKEISKRRSTAKSTFKGVIKPAADFIGKHYGGFILKTGSKIGLGNEIENLRSFLSATPTNYELELFSRRAYYTYEKASNRLGYSPRFDLTIGLQLSIKWLSHVGCLQRFASGSS
jgi:nucleoside-diphosphate-sugar epimerase